jgi:hypothetical protein
VCASRLTVVSRPKGCVQGSALRAAVVWFSAIDLRLPLESQLHSYSPFDTPSEATKTDISSLNGQFVAMKTLATPTVSRSEKLLHRVERQHSGGWLARFLTRPPFGDDLGHKGWLSRISRAEPHIVHHLGLKIAGWPRWCRPMCIAFLSDFHTDGTRATLRASTQSLPRLRVFDPTLHYSAAITLTCRYSAADASHQAQ